MARFHSPQGATSDIISTWAELNESLLKHDDFGKYIKNGSRFAKEIIEEDLELAGLDDKEKAKKIIEYVKNSFEWNGYYSKYASQSAKDFINTKNGNVADINLFLIALLSEANIEVQPLILSTRNHGKIPSDYPFDSFTNYVIALVNTNSPFMADGTEDLLPFDRLPPRCINEKGIIVTKEDEPQWISMKSNILSLERKVIMLTIDPLTLDAKTNVSIQSTQYDSFSNRESFRDDTLKIKEYYSDKIGAINRTTTIGYKNTSLPYSINFEGSYETEKLGENIVLNPFLNLPLSVNNLTQKVRSYPVDFVYPWDEQFEATMVIPDGFTLTTLPESYKMDDDLAEINLDYTFSGVTLTAIGNYRFKKAIYVATEYSKIKYYLDQIVKHFNQSIVLEINN